MPAGAVVADDEQTDVPAVVVGGECDECPLWCSIETSKDYWTSTACERIRNDREPVGSTEWWGRCERVWVQWAESFSSLIV